MPRIDLIQIRRGTTAEWAAADPVLAAGELGYDTDLNTLKAGNAVAAYSARTAIGAAGGAAWGSITGTLSAQTDLNSALSAKLTASLVSAAALTVLDDTTLDAMLATLGGAAVQGSGGLVRATSPTLTTPNLGTPSALVGTNITGTAASLTAGIASAVALGGITGLGANVATALAIAVGSAGAPVTFNGALGTPSSGVGTNLTIKDQIGLACSDETTAITTGTGKLTFRMPFAMTLTAVRASVTTAPTGSTIIIDINEAGTTILSTKLSIDATEKTSTTAASAAVISDAALADDSEISVDFDQVGSTIAGTGVKVFLIGTRA